MLVPVRIILFTIIFSLLMISSFYIFETKTTKPLLVNCYEFSKIINKCEDGCVNYTKVTLVENCPDLGVQKGIYNIKCTSTGECIIYNTN